MVTNNTQNIIYQTVNGFDLVCKPVAGLHSAAIGVWLQNGCRYERDEQHGYAHFFEHLVFRGTKHHTGKQLSTLFESMGGSINAETGRELTGFYGHVPSSRGVEFLRLLLDMLFTPAFNEREFQLERDVVLQELAMLNDDPEVALEDFATEQVWPNHSIGRQILGSKKSLRQASAESLYQYANDVVTKQKLLIVAAGNIDPGELSAVCADYTYSPHVNVQSSPPQFVKTTARLSLDCEQVQLQWLMPAPAYTAKQAADYSIANHILAGGYDSRLYQALREELGLVYSVGSHIDKYQDTGLWFVQTNTEAEQADRVITAVEQAMQELIDYGPTEQELANAREHLKSHYIINADDLQISMESIAQDIFYYGKAQSLEQKLAAYDQVTLASLQQVYAQAWRQASNFSAD